MRIIEARLVSIEARITMSERALSATELRQRDPYRIKTLEQQWELNLNAALSRSAEIRKSVQLPLTAKPTALT